MNYSHKNNKKDSLVDLVKPNVSDDAEMKELITYHLQSSKHRLLRVIYQKYFKAMGWQTALQFSTLFKRVGDIGIAIICLLLLSPIAILGVLYSHVSRRKLSFSADKQIGCDGEVFFRYRFFELHEYKKLSWLLTKKEKISCARLVARELEEKSKLAKPWFIRTNFYRIPEFINVVNGDMTLIGVATKNPCAVERFSLKQRQSLCLKPGLWQWPGRLSTFKNTFIERNLDKEYIESQAIRKDFAILLALQIQIFLTRKAY